MQTQKTPLSPATVNLRQLTAQELIAAEHTPGSTEPLPHAVEPASAPIDGVAGTPGPSPAYGPEDAPVRIFLFTDFQCGVCSRAVEPLKYLVRSHPNDVRLVVKQNAAPAHARAAPAAAAALAAFRQRNFWAYHDKLFREPGPRDDASLVAYAQAIGLDVNRFQRDLTDEAVVAQVKYETGLAVRLGLTGTPGFVINGVPQIGWGSYASLEETVQRELHRAKSIAASGVPPARVAYEATRTASDKGKAIAAALFASK